MKSKLFQVFLELLFTCIISFVFFDSGFARMKVFERERRLLAREHRKKLAAEKEELAAE